MRLFPFWIVFNAVSAALYVYFGMALWVQPGEEGLPGGPGDAFYWVLTQVPVLLVVSIVNFAALLVLVQRSGKVVVRQAARRWLLVAIAWVAVIAYDHAHTYRNINPEYVSVAEKISGVTEPRLAAKSVMRCNVA